MIIMVMESNKLIYTEHHNISDEFCIHCIDKFESDTRKHVGEIGHCIVNEDIKQSTDLHISALNEWKEEDDTLYNALKIGLNNYKNHVPNDYEYVLFHSIKDTGYQIQKTEPKQYYAWHHDQSDQQCRVLTYMWYFNTISEGGYTEFCNGLRVYPDRGKLLIFPATWEYIHRGFPPLFDTKYVCIGWTVVHRDFGIT